MGNFSIFQNWMLQKQPSHIQKMSNRNLKAVIRSNPDMASQQAPHKLRTETSINSDNPRGRQSKIGHRDQPKKQQEPDDGVLRKMILRVNQLNQSLKERQSSIFRQREKISQSKNKIAQQSKSYIQQQKQISQIVLNQNLSQNKGKKRKSKNTQSNNEVGQQYRKYQEKRLEKQLRNRAQSSVYEENRKLKQKINSYISDNKRLTEQVRCLKQEKEKNQQISMENQDHKEILKIEEQLKRQRDQKIYLLEQLEKLREKLEVLRNQKIVLIEESRSKQNEKESLEKVNLIKENELIKKKLTELKNQSQEFKQVHEAQKKQSEQRFINKENQLQDKQHVNKKDYESNLLKANNQLIESKARISYLQQKFKSHLVEIEKQDNQIKRLNLQNQKCRQEMKAKDEQKQNRAKELVQLMKKLKNLC